MFVEFRLTIIPSGIEPASSSCVPTQLQDHVKTESEDEEAQWYYQDKTGWRHYEKVYRDENGERAGACRWSAPPPKPIEGDSPPDPNVMMQDEKTKKFHPIPAGFEAPGVPVDWYDCY